MDKKAQENDGLRRKPTQARSRERFESILDAAAHIFVEIGFEAATTEHIAKQAKTSIGSVYRFFPNKAAVFDALVARNNERARKLHANLVVSESDDTLAADKRRGWSALIDAVIDQFRGLLQNDIGFRAIALNIQHSQRAISAEHALNREFIERTQVVIGMYASEMPPAQRAHVSSLINYVIQAVLFFTAQSDEDFADGIIAETKTMLARYLAPYLGDE